MSGITEAKQSLRAVLATRRQGQPAEVMQRHSVAAQEALLAEAAWQQAQQVALYVPVRGEMGTEMLLADAWQSGKQVLLPRCRKGQPGHMDFVLCQSRADLCPGFFGILEPRKELFPLSWDADVGDGLNPHMVVLPGVGFDRRGYRLGFGGGYYDRVLAHPRVEQATLVGLAYSWQIVDDLPLQAWDKAVQALCTEEGVLWL